MSRFSSPHAPFLSRETRSQSMTDAGSSPNRYFQSRRSSGSLRQYDDSASSPGDRESGSVEKIVGTYGFINFHDRRDPRIFFHMSSVENPNDLMTGSEVQFSVEHDSRSGKPIATNVKAMSGGMEPLDDKRYHGVVESEPKAQLRRTRSNPVHQSKSGFSSFDMGQICSRENGEAFFIPFSQDGLQDRRAQLKLDNQVSFVIYIDRRSGRKEARSIRLEESPSPSSSSGSVCRGIVRDVRERFGFIERADVNSRMFFHFSEVQSGDPHIGDSVEFTIQEQSDGRLCACDVQILPQGTVQVEEIDQTERQGTVVEGLDSARKLEDGLRGKLSYELDGRMEHLYFSDREFDGSFSLLRGDRVIFRGSRDMRTGQPKAVEVALTKLSSDPPREQGVVCALREASNYGFVRCVENDDVRVFFHFDELLDKKYVPDIGDEVEFSVAEGQGQQQRAIRVSRLPPGSVEVIDEELLQGVVQSTPRLCQRHTVRSPSTKEFPEREMEPGIICLDSSRCVPYQERDCADPKVPPSPGDEVVFYMCEHRSTGKKRAVKVSVVQAAEVVSSKGYVVAVKHSFGFIETADHREQVYFHFRAMEKDCPDLALKDEVSFIITHRGGRTSAESVAKLEAGTIDLEVVTDDVWEGTVLRPTQDAENEVTSYEGVIEASPECLMSMTKLSADGCPYRGAVVALAQSALDTTGILCVPFSISSLVDTRSIPQKGEQVLFSLSVIKATKRCRAVQVKSKQSIYRGHVDSLKEGFGFIQCEDGHLIGETVFFHMSEFQYDCQTSDEELRVGDTVEFVLIHNQKRGKPQACDVRRVSDQRPERLSVRLEGADGAGPRISVRRQPYQPDGTCGFRPRRKHVCGEYDESDAEETNTDAGVV